MHRLLESSLRTLAVSAVVLSTCAFASGAQVGVWNFTNDLNNSIGGKLPLAVEGTWTPTYVNDTINGSPATVLSFPKFDTTQAIAMTNQGADNGPGGVTATNNWSIALDVMFPAVVSFTSIYETDALGLGDADYFLNASRAIGTGGQYAGEFPENTWTRMVVTVDTTVTAGTYVVKGYLDGVLTSTSTTGSAPGGNQGVKDFLHLFADNDFETTPGYLNSVAYYGETLNDAAVGALGAAAAAGIPSALNQVGHWNFDNNLNNSIGGKTAMSAVGGWTPAYEIQSIGGSDATVLAFPGFDETQALDMPNQAPKDPAGGPFKTNVWSIVMDVKFPTLSGFTSLFNTDALGAADGEYFIRDDSGAGAFGSLGISGDYNGVFNADTWTRVAVTVDGSVAGAYVLTGYIDGVPVGEGVSTGTSPDARFAIDQILHLFNDTDDLVTVESSAGSINSLAYYDEVLIPEAIAALGAASAAGIAVTAPVTDADFDNNGVVDGADFLAWQRGFGINSGAANSQGDADLNGKVDAADLALWKSSFGGASAAPAASAVPEPAAAALATLALGAIAAVRRRRD